jgi:hypothetical protein
MSDEERQVIVRDSVFLDNRMLEILAKLEQQSKDHLVHEQLSRDNSAMLEKLEERVFTLHGEVAALKVRVHVISALAGSISGIVTAVIAKLSFKS